MDSDFSLLNEILNPKTFEYELSEKLFLDIWEKWGRPQELTNSKEIAEFLNEIIEKSKGYVILDHFSHINYDNINRIEYKEPYTLIYWQDNNKYREKYLSQTISEDELMVWQINGFATYIYMLLHIKKLKFVKIGSHLFILFMVNLIPPKIIKQFLLKPPNKLISEENNKESLYKEFIFWEGDQKDCIKHMCIVNNLPYYTCLLQPKERNFDTLFSQILLLSETLNDITERMDRVYESLVKLNDFDYDELFSQGNKVRRILEYALKFFCLYTGIELKIDEKYGHVKLRDLKNEINKHYEQLNINKELIITANELSHDSGEVFSKEEVINFWKEAKELLDQIKIIIMKNEC
jgi:hypothetical protein